MSLLRPVKPRATRSADMVASIDYLGNIGTNTAEISEGSEVEVNLPGNVAFWAEQQHIYSTVDAAQYRVQGNSTIRIDGAEIHLAPGDTVLVKGSRAVALERTVRGLLDAQ